MKPITLTDRELNKLLKIFGKKEIINKHILDVIRLTNSQLGYVCDYGKEKPKEEEPSIWRKVKLSSLRGDKNESN